MDKLAAPLMVVLAIGAYFLVNQQFKNVKQAVQQQQAAPVVLPKPVIPVVPPFQPFKVNNPFAPRPEEPEPAEDDFTPVPFESANGFYRANFPGGKPKHLSFPLFQVKVHCYRIAKQVATFEVNYYDSGWREGETTRTPQQWLKRIHALQIGGMHAREETYREVMIDDRIPGAEFEALFLKGDKPQMWVGKTYLVGRDIVTASCYGDAGVVSLRGPEFLKSFLLTHKAIEAAKE